VKWLLVLAACGAPQALPPDPVEPTIRRVFREQLIDASGVDTLRSTYELETTGTSAKLVVTHERASITQLDMHTAWAFERRLTYYGTLHGAIDGSTSGASLDFAPEDDELPVRLHCVPQGHMVMPAHARISVRLADCEDPPERAWEPWTTQYVAMLVCRRGGTGSDGGTLVTTRDLAFADPPGVEWVEERTACKVYGSGFRWR